jgi:hypothetical protein
MVKKIWRDDKYQLEIGYSQKSETQEQSKISLNVENQEDWQHYSSIELDEMDVYELIEELKIWLNIINKDNKNLEV